jgi:hypothetical protein
MNETITIHLSAEEGQLLVNALEILSPDDPEAQERLHELYCKLLTAHCQDGR